MPASAITPIDIEIAAGYLPGLIGRVVELHALYYARNWHFTAFFEARVATEMRQFITRYDPSRDATWSALVDRTIDASITIDGIDAAGQGAHLRWFIASERVRGQGLGRRLLERAMEFCRERDYRRIYLETFDGLEPARHLYQAFGFELIESRLGEQWGSRIEEQRYLAEI